jgi:hypothetical protein
MVIIYAKEVSRVYSVSGSNVNKRRHRAILGSSITRKLFCGPRMGCLEQIENKELRLCRTVSENFVWTSNETFFSLKFSIIEGGLFCF